jgi:hypothetical protein
VALAETTSTSGLIVDRVRVRTANVDTFFDGTFEKQNDFFVKLRTAAGRIWSPTRRRARGWRRCPAGIQIGRRPGDRDGADADGLERPPQGDAATSSRPAAG